MTKMNVPKIKTYRVPMSRTEGAYAYIKATSIKEALAMFNNNEIDRMEYDSSFAPDGTNDFVKDGPIERYYERGEEDI